MTKAEDMALEIKDLESELEEAKGLLKEWSKSQWKDFVTGKSDLLKRTNGFLEVY